MSFPTDLSFLNEVAFLFFIPQPPYLDGPHFESAAKVLNKYKGLVNYAASINTIGNGEYEYNLCLDIEAMVFHIWPTKDIVLVERL